ncbi:MAG: hypothetical protein DRI44_00680 [Chlamydiae bacterium]|nr:MAG: hypothetical protein DRI44_00680 [Chlamydiota bacterium]
MNKHYIGIDFGTSNSYFCITPDDVLQPNPICFDNDTSIETAVLWENNEVKDFGSSAVKGWNYASPADKRNWRLSLQFKPDISSSARAKDDAVAFLRSAARYMKERNLLPNAREINNFNVIIGIPAKILAGHKDAMREIMTQAGFDNFKLVEEPVAALLHHIIRHDINTEDIGNGILVIDFGGGTCDVAFMLRLDVKHKFGDPLLGGRLFDDLFYQWFLSQNANVESKFEGASDSYYLHWVKCREMKETFSNTMRKNKNEIFSFHIPNYGHLDNATWEEFIHRAENYTPDKSFLKELKSYGKAYEKLTSEKTINLIQHFREAIESVIKNNKIKIENIEHVILTGGSSVWSFVREIVLETFFLENKQILESANPRAAIGEGLALLPLIKERFNVIKNKLKREQYEKSLEITKSVMADVQDFYSCISDEIIEKIFNEAVAPAVNSFSKKGGTTEQLNSLIRVKVEDLQPEFEKIIEIQKPELKAEISDRITNILNNWFESHNIKKHNIDINLPSVRNTKIQFGNINVPSELEFIIASIGGLITASLLGGGGIALLMAGPGGWLIGLGIGTAGIFFGMKKLTSKIPIPGMLMDNIVTRKAIDISLKRAKAKTRRKMLNYLNKQFVQNKEILNNQISNFIVDQIKSLDAINSI